MGNNSHSTCRNQACLHYLIGSLWISFWGFGVGGDEGVPETPIPLNDL